MELEHILNKDPKDFVWDEVFKAVPLLSDRIKKYFPDQNIMFRHVAVEDGSVLSSLGIDDFRVERVTEGYEEASRTVLYLHQELYKAIHNKLGPVKTGPRLTLN